MKVAIAGYGLEGKANQKYWQDLGHETVILDERVLHDTPEGIEVVTGKDVFDYLEPYDMVVRTASLPPVRLMSAKKVWSSTNEFFEKCPAPIIGVTGTKGKGTTSSLIAEILRAQKHTVHLIGNIGVPPLSVLPKIKPSHLVVFEMSSFQLWDLERSPHVAVILMIEVDHQNVHATFQEYTGAKGHIVLHQTPQDVVVYNERNEHSSAIGYASPGKQYPYPDTDFAHVENDAFWFGEQFICSTSSLKLPGKHNIENACAAINATWDLVKGDTSVIEKGLGIFDGLPHRLKLIAEKNGVRYYDDNYSSAPGATIAAIRSFTEPEVLIIGGYDKKITFDELAEAVALQANVKKIVLIGQTRHILAKALDAKGLREKYVVSDETTLRPIVELANSFTASGDVLIMSPACASFDMFTNFTERGEQFIEVVEGL
jgi:UDP-N-acetylmuramoylalanine--D-glutamate ligase